MSIFLTQLQAVLYNSPCGNHQTVKDGCLVIIPRKSGMEACTQLSREILSPEVIHITFFECITLALGAATLLTNLVSCILSILDRIDKMKKK